MPIKGKVSLDGVSKILRETSKIIGFDNTEYYLIAGLDKPGDVNDWVSRLKGVAKPQIHVFTPYSPRHFDLMIGSRMDQLINALKVRANILELYGEGIPAGSNRSLFHLSGE